VEPEAVAQTLVAGLAAYGVAATVDVRVVGEGSWLLSLDAEPDGIDLEVTTRATTLRVHSVRGVFEDVSLGDALNHAARAAGVLTS
jgi:hypothetical protein